MLVSEFKIDLWAFFFFSFFLSFLFYFILFFALFLFYTQFNCVCILNTDILVVFTYQPLYVMPQ